jgi:hypothetical protein
VGRAQGGNRGKGHGQGCRATYSACVSVPARTSGHSLSPILGFAYLGPVSFRLAEPGDQPGTASAPRWEHGIWEYRNGVEVSRSSFCRADG